MNLNRAHHTTWRNAYLLTLLACILLIVFVVVLQRHVDRDRAARADFLRTVDEKCIPTQDGESAIAVRDHGIVRCHVYTRNSPGLARVLVSSAVMEAPQ